MVNTIKKFLVTALACFIASCGAEEIQSLTAENQALVIANKALATENETLNQDIDYLKKQDHYVLSQAGALLDDGDVPGALKAYQSFVRDFPSSSGAEVATKQISALQDSLKKTRLAEVAEQERQQLAAIRSLRFDELTSDKLIRQYLVGRWVAPDFMGLGASGTPQLARKRMMEFLANGTVVESQSNEAYVNVYKMGGYTQIGGGKYSIFRKTYSNTGEPYIHIEIPDSPGHRVLLEKGNVRHDRARLRNPQYGTYVRVD